MEIFFANLIASIIAWSNSIDTNLQNTYLITIKIVIRNLNWLDIQI